MSKTKGLLFTAGIVLATAFTFSCSEDLEPIERETLEEYERMLAQSSTVSSSSGEPSSNSDVPSSSSSESYSSSFQPSSSSTVSSSSGEPSSNSDVPSSSSSESYSSSFQPSSSSTVSSSSKVETKCGTRAEIFDPDLYECRDVNKIYLKTPVNYEGENYEAVLIGNQTWLARNLNYNTSGSFCYGDDSGSDSQNRCGTYGRLYNWATAMNLPPSCNSTFCSNLAQSKRKDICPDGWHIPSNADLDKLYCFADGTSGTSSPYESIAAGGYLKATNGWSNGGSGTDNYGFSALPGGYGLSDGNFNHAGDYGDWWSASETEGNGGDAYFWNMVNYNKSALRGNDDKSSLLSVRCVKD